ncbi:tryptophan synthase beta subunit-like PLP-dependent enzyme [Rhizoctonia solani]|nr:tryptophan synthase beta subunit-like PLP-dependent enzyme [Rhizoctonia solani]
MNVFSGKTALLDFYNPDKNPPLPLVELPSHPFEDDNVRIYAKMLTLLPAGNVKSLPALNMLMRASEASQINDSTERIVEYSSGNTVISLGIVSKIMGGPQVGAYISNKTSPQKMELLRFFGLDLTLFGGPAQVEPADVNGGIHAAIQDGMRPGWYNPGQYSSPQNSEAHVRWTGPQIYAQLPKINVFAAAVGTSGTMTGTGSYLKTVRPDLVNLGVFTAPGDRVPGPRPIDLVQTVDLPWQEVIDAAEHVSSKDSYRISLDLCRQGLLVGPSSGLSLQGLYQYLEKAKKNDELDALRADDGSVYCAFICCDQPYQYISDYFTKLEASCFPPIYNTELLDKDLYPYGVDWILTPNDAFRLLYPAHGLQTPPAEPTELDDEFKNVREPLIHAHAIILDLRSSVDFTRAHIHGSKNLDIQCAGAANPFKDPAMLAELWETLRQALIPHTKNMSNKSVLLVSYNEEIAYVGCSVLRKEGVKAFALGGGFEKWKEAGLDAGAPTARH